MPRFFFHLRDHRGLLEDPDGRFFDDLDRVRAAALKDARSIMCHDIENGSLDLRGWIEVVDEAGGPVFVLKFTAAVDLTLDPPLEPQ